MPEIIQIADYGMTLGKKPLRTLRTPVKMAEADSATINRVVDTIRTAKMQKAVGGIRLAMIALANGRFEEAGNIAVNSAVEASAAFKQDPKMAARVIITARGVVRNAIRGVMSRSV